VPATIEFRCQERANDVVYDLGSSCPSADCNDIGIVVLSSQPRGLLVPRKGGANARNFVRGYLHADAAATHENSALDLAARDGFGYACCEIRIID